MNPRREGCGGRKVLPDKLRCLDPAELFEYVGHRRITSDMKECREQNTHVPFFKKVHDEI